MTRQVLLLTDADTTPGLELMESLRLAGIAVAHECLSESNSKLDDSSQWSCLLYEIEPDASIDELRFVIERAVTVWPQVPILACRRYRSAARSAPAPNNEALKRLGFQAVADSPTQLPALLRHLEDAPITGELKPLPDFHSTPSSAAFCLPVSVPSEQTRGAFALAASLHLAKNQKEAAQIALASVARLVSADRWSIFLANQTSNPDAIVLQPLVSRILNSQELSFDDAWQREWFQEAQSRTDPPSQVAHEAAVRLETLTKNDGGHAVLAAPLVSEDILLGVIEGMRNQTPWRSFSRSEIALLAALSIPIASAVRNSVRISDAERLSHTDDLTKLHNARYLRQFLVNEIKRARRYHSNVAALFLDLDDFKRVNDVHGHLVGSHALMEIASVILPSVRDTDCVVRYGGDEFVVILPETAIDEAIRVAERIRTKLEHHRFTGGRGLKLSLTASFGLATFPQHALSPQQLISKADTAMYEAKAGGKNCVRVSTIASRIGEGADSNLLFPASFLKIPDEKLIS